MTVLGIDPGSRALGYGALESSAKGPPVLRGCGVISPPKKLDFSQRVLYIHNALDPIYRTYKPAHTAVEKMFFGKNADTAFKLGHIFSICILLSAQHKSLFFEYSSRFIKKSVAFSGRASKEMTRRFINNALRMEVQGSMDLSDALACGLCHLQEMEKPDFLKNRYAL